jgi:hypothetical protein
MLAGYIATTGWKTMRMLLMLGALLPAVAMADATIPHKDIQGMADLPYLKRYKGSFIVDQLKQEFNEITLPLSMLEQTDQKDNLNLPIYRPKKELDLEGKIIRTIYVLPADRSPRRAERDSGSAILVGYVMADRPAGIRPTTSQSGMLAGCRTIVAFGFRAGRTFSRSIYSSGARTCWCGTSTPCATHAAGAAVSNRRLGGATRSHALRHHVARG